MLFSAYLNIFNIINFMKEKNVTYVDIAKEAKVSIGTLSRFFNNGYVSQDKKDSIEKAIKKFQFTPNSAAASIKKGNNFYIVIRTFASSKSQDMIVEGIISQLGKNILVKYSKTDSKSIIDEVNWSMSLKPKGIICFASTDINEEFVNELSKLDANIILYGYKTNKLTYTKLSFDNAIKKLSESINEIDFIYDNKDDFETYVSQKELFEKNGITVHSKREVTSSNRYIYFQNRKVMLEEMHKVIDPRKVIISFKTQEKMSINDFAFVSDYFLVGVYLAKQIEGKIKSKDVEVHFFNKKTG